MQDLVNKIHHIDAIELLCSLPDTIIDMVLCDLPYGVTACKWDTIIPIEPMWKELRRVVKRRSAIVLTATQPFTSRLVSSNYKWYRSCWVWDKVKKSGFQLANKRQMIQHEDVIVFGFPSVKYYPVITKKPYKNYGENTPPTSILTNKLIPKNVDPTNKFPSSILSFSNANQNVKLHPTQKPVALFEYLIRTYTLEGEIVLDMTCGSGTTAVAAKNLGRNFICGDTDPHYVEITQHRVEYGEEAAVKKHKKKQDNISEKLPTDPTTTLFDLI